jgi:hypothetical protein
MSFEESEWQPVRIRRESEFEHPYPKLHWSKLNAGKIIHVRLNNGRKCHLCHCDYFAVRKDDALSIVPHPDWDKHETEMWIPLCQILAD